MLTIGVLISLKICLVPTFIQKTYGKLLYSYIILIVRIKTTLSIKIVNYNTSNMNWLIIKWVLKGDTINHSNNGYTKDYLLYSCNAFICETQSPIALVNTLTSLILGISLLVGVEILYAPMQHRHMVLGKIHEENEQDCSYSFGIVNLI